MKGSGYSPLHQSHNRINTERDARNAGKEITDRRAEKKDAAVTRAARSAAPERETESKSASTRVAAELERTAEAVQGPAKGETDQHYEWRRVQTSRIQRENEAEAARSAGKAPAGAEPHRPDGSTGRIAVPDGPAPNETQLHFAWRQHRTRSLARAAEKAGQREAKGGKAEEAPETDS